ncbi:glycoside hydrolase family 43 protein [Paenibacillus sp. Soil787]|uniref:glycoside hydrolase family 43 protein n=1 Tax=Paenibacillus sp. Soil787 TaxID=1736411 RepID=UPI0006F72BF0|nr:glycoside hydrolase family 43 protein [Paenibacillus sp. Soil787]KRF43739.1 beta-xylosidase [Paenibacillus sp. Soil787]
MTISEAKLKITNPVLPGFNPDPWMVRVGDDYYIATSTFEWFPGVAIYHSRDMVHWQLLTYPLSKGSQLDLLGVPSSGGIWAPNLTYDNGTFYLLYTNVVGRKGVFKDLHNYLITAENIMGPWSEPIYLNAKGFDPAFFHDDDGRKWLMQMRWDFRTGHPRFSGILMQEYNHAEGRLVGEESVIYRGTEIGVTEGPSMFKKDGYYYLITAEGGTGCNHAVTVARSRNIEGPYETAPDNPMMTTAYDREHPLQNAGHAAFVETQNGEWYISHLGIRVLPDGRRLNPLGRETLIQRIVWTEDGWPRLENGTRLPSLEVAAPGLEPHPFAPIPERDDFDAPQLNIHFSTLRTPADESWLSLQERPGYLRLSGRESLNSWHKQSMVARRVQHFECEAETCVEFDPQSFFHMAGLVCYYDELDYYYLRISHDERLGKHIGVAKSVGGKYEELLESVVIADGWERCYLRVTIEQGVIQFAVSADGSSWPSIGPALDFGVLSDEYGGKLGFTGAMVGICAQDMSGGGHHADFDYFTYRELM